MNQTGRKRKLTEIEIPSERSIIIKREQQQQRIDYVNDIKAYTFDIMVGLTAK